MFQQAVNDYFLMGWTPLALGLDSNGYPKRPLAPAWTGIPHTAQAIRGQPWEHAKGIGIALGSQSNNLAAIDLDDVELAKLTVQELMKAGVRTRMVWTIRKRVHIFFQEKAASASTRREYEWQGRTIGVELKANGTQVATVPTPGYELACDAPVLAVPTIEMAWLSIVKRMGITPAQNTDAQSSGNYPPPWKSKVPEGERNKAIFIEAHKLREAGMPLEQALEIMQARVERDYVPGNIPWHELRATVESAYRKGLPNELTGEPDEHHYITRRARTP